MYNVRFAASNVKPSGAENRALLAVALSTIPAVVWLPATLVALTALYDNFER